MDLQKGVLFGLGNILLDIVVTVPEAFLEKFNLEPDSIRLAEELHSPIFDEIRSNGSSFVEYAPGGCALNTIRVAQWILKYPKATTFVGAVGNDDDSTKLMTLLENEGIGFACQRIPNLSTGRCAVLITGNRRTLVTQLGAALKFSYEEFIQSKSYAILDTAKVFYISGYFLKVSHETAMNVARFAKSKDRPVVLNLNATWVVRLCKEELKEIISYVDFLIGNHSEMLEFAEVNECPYVTIPEVSKWASKLLKLNNDRERVVMVTRGADPLIVTTGDYFKEIPVISVPEPKIIDTNGAGDAFAGGFLAGLVKGKTNEICVSYGLWAASEIIQHRGCNFSTEVTYPNENTDSS